MNRRRAVGLVQNPDDRDLLAEIGVKPDHIVMIPGSGIDADRFRPIPEPDGPVTFAYVGRMLDDKGVRNLIAAFRIVREDRQALPSAARRHARSRPIPASIPQIEMAAWGREPGVTWLGEVADIAALWQRAHVAVLPSRREGLPKSLLEAAACGRPLIATDVPGCREIAIHEKTGLLVPVDDPAALAAAMERLARSSQQRIRLGVAARRLVDERFAADLIGKATVDALSAPARNRDGSIAMGLQDLALDPAGRPHQRRPDRRHAAAVAALCAGASERALLPQAADAAGRRCRGGSRRLLALGSSRCLFGHAQDACIRRAGAARPRRSCC